MAKQNKNIKNNTIQIDDKYQSSYNEESLFSTLSKYAAKMGKKTVEQALTLYYALKEDSGIAEKAIIISALGYLIMPFDLLPDFLPGGFVDDISMMVAALQCISVSPAVKQLVKKKLKEYFD